MAPPNHQLNSQSDLTSIFYPQSIALANIIDSRFKGIVYPVNPKAKGVLGIKCYDSVLNIQDTIDLAVIVVPSSFVPLVLEECGQKGIKGAIIISAGFKEIGEEGLKLEEKIKHISQNYHISQPELSHIIGRP